MIDKTALVRERLTLRDGVLTWKRTGEPVSCHMKRGYRCFKITAPGKRMITFSEHRVIWLLHHGEWPKHTIDHINRNPTDNRIENLRDVTQAENNRNRATIDYIKSLRLEGWITRSREGWMAFIKPKAVRVYLGRYETQEEADAARIGAARLLAALRSADFASVSEPAVERLVAPEGLHSQPFNGLHYAPSVATSGPLP